MSKKTMGIVENHLKLHSKKTKLEERLTTIEQVENKGIVKLLELD